MRMRMRMKMREEGKKGTSQKRNRLDQKGPSYIEKIQAI